MFKHMYNSSAVFVKNKLLFFILAVLIAAYVVVMKQRNDTYKLTLINMSEDGGSMNYSEVFSKIYNTESWGRGKGSGDGSVPENAKIYIAFLQNYFNDPKFNKIVDLGCGDWQIMNNISIPKGKEYFGYDVAEHIIVNNQNKFKDENVKFFHINNLKEFVENKVNGDLLIVKDVLQHLPTSEIKYFIANVLPNFKYALITNEYEVTSIMHNKDIMLGGFRSLSMLDEPFNMPNAKVILEYDGPGHKQILLYIKGS